MVQELTTPRAKAVGHTALALHLANKLTNNGDSNVYVHAPHPKDGGWHSRDELAELIDREIANSHYQLLSALKAIRSDAQHFLVAGGDLETIAQEVLLKAEQAISEAESEAAHG